MASGLVPKTSITFFILYDSLVCFFVFLQRDIVVGTFMLSMPTLVAPRNSLKRHLPTFAPIKPVVTNILFMFVLDSSFNCSLQVLPQWRKFGIGSQQSQRILLIRWDVLFRYYICSSTPRKCTLSSWRCCSRVPRGVPSVILAKALTSLGKHLPP